jgi:hypothetical protein
MHTPTVYLVEPITDNCRNWCELNHHIEDIDRVGKMFAVESGHIDGLIALLADEGFVQEEDYQVIF